MANPGFDQVFGFAGTGHASGTVPDPGTAADGRFLSVTGWMLPPGGAGSTGPAGPTGPTGPQGPTGPGGTLIAWFPAGAVTLAAGTWTTIVSSTPPAGNMLVQATVYAQLGGTASAVAARMQYGGFDIGAAELPIPASQSASIPLPAIFLVSNGSDQLVLQGQNAADPAVVGTMLTGLGDGPATVMSAIAPPS